VATQGAHREGSRATATTRGQDLWRNCARSTGDLGPAGKDLTVRSGVGTTSRGCADGGRTNEVGHAHGVTTTEGPGLHGVTSSGRVRDEPVRHRYVPALRERLRFPTTFRRGAVGEVLPADPLRVGKPSAFRQRAWSRGWGARSRSRSKAGDRSRNWPHTPFPATRNADRIRASAAAGRVSRSRRRM